MLTTNPSFGPRLLDPAGLVARLGDAIAIGAGCEIAEDAVIEVGPGGFLAFGDRVSVRRGVVIEVSRGATVVFGDDVTIGENVFIFSMVGIHVGDGCGISNMVDLHDHNHRDRSPAHLASDEWTTYASGFDAAPIVIESGAILSNKCTVVAGVRIGHNTIVGANSAVTRSLPPNAVAVGAPAAVVRRFQGPAPAGDDRRALLVGCFGTSIMEHLEAHADRLSHQWDLPPVGTQVTVERWRHGGYLRRLALSLQAAHPHVRFDFRNLAVGGATSRDLLAVLRDAVSGGAAFDLVLWGCGVNDVWRGFQGRAAEAVGIDEYVRNWRDALELLRPASRRIVCVGETPFGFPDAREMNEELARYCAAARGVAAAAGIPYVDPWPAFAAAAGALRAGPVPTEAAPSVWSDGVHLSELGDTVVLQAVEGHLRESGAVEALEHYERCERDAALARYRSLCASWRSRAGGPEAADCRW